MKVMDESMESDDCTITKTAAPKIKKMKQARLPFQNLSSPTTPNTQSAKKRKHMSPSPTTFRSPKIVKITTKENNDRKSSIEEKDAIPESPNGDKDVDKKSMSDSEKSSEKSEKNGATDEPVLTNKIVEVKGQDKPGAITRFFKKSNTEEKKKTKPFLVLTRCDNSGAESAVLDPKKDEDEEPRLPKEDESSNEEVLAHPLENSETEDDAASKDKLDVSSDNAGENSDSDSDRGMSSSDDETEDPKTDVDNADDSVTEKSLIRTPTSSVKTDGAAAARRKLTPKQLAKKMDSTKRREEREKLKLEKDKKREEEKLNRLKEKEAKQREKKEKEEAEKELRRKEKEQKDLKKQKEIEQKQKEKERKDKAKEEDRRKREESKEEEKRKKEEEEKKKLEAKRKELKAASTFVSFFVPKKAETKTVAEEKIVITSQFIPFEVKVDMRVAPICRRRLDDLEKTKFDEICVNKAKETDDLYIAEIKKNRRKMRKSGKTWPPEPKDDDIAIIEDDNVGDSCNVVDQNNAVTEKQRAKFLGFTENRRPPYWGTWRKRSSTITPRKPFSKDTKWFDYDVDSDDEWEEEEPGESLRGSDDEKDEENPDDNEYDVDNEFMVPHGYLSDEEAQADEDEEDMSPETQKLKLKILGAEFEEERKTQTSKIKPRIIGPIWQNRDNSYPETLPQKIMEFLTARQAWTGETPIVIASLDTNGTNVSENSGISKSQSGKERRGAKKTKVPTEALPELIRLIHGNVHGLNFLIKEFMTFWNRKHKDCDRPLSKSSLNQKIRELAKRIACPEEGPMHLKACWYVSEETRNEYLGDERLILPNSWSYALTPRRKTLTDASEIAEKSEKEDKEKKTVPLITQYTKKITPEEMKKQLEVKPGQSFSPKASTSQSKPPKRATLISVTRGEQFPKSSIINAFSRASTSIQTAAIPKNEKLVVELADKSQKDVEIVDLDSNSNV